MKLLMMAGLLSLAIVGCSKDDGNGYGGGQSNMTEDAEQYGYTYIGTAANADACHILCQNYGYTGSIWYGGTLHCYCR